MLMLETTSGFSIANNYGSMSECGTLARESVGGCVCKLQRIINSLGYPLKVDGIFGEETEKAVRLFQQITGLEVDGVVGRKTWDMLMISSKEAQAMKPPYCPVPEKIITTPTISKDLLPFILIAGGGLALIIALLTR